MDGLVGITTGDVAFRENHDRRFMVFVACWGLTREKPTLLLLPIPQVLRWIEFVTRSDNASYRIGVKFHCMCYDTLAVCTEVMAMYHRSLEDAGKWAGIGPRNNGNVASTRTIPTLTFSNHKTKNSQNCKTNN